VGILITGIRRSLPMQVPMQVELSQTLSGKQCLQLPSFSTHLCTSSRPYTGSLSRWLGSCWWSRCSMASRRRRSYHW
jgi:hypothetical protein